TGPFSHQLVIGGSYQHQTNDYAANSIYTVLGNGNLYQPNPFRFYSGSGLETYRAGDITQASAFASDTIAFTSRWSLLAGIRYTNYSQNAFATTGEKTSSYSQNGVFTPTVALMYKLEPSTTIYASYVEALEQGALVDAMYANGGSMLRP